MVAKLSFPWVTISKNITAKSGICISRSFFKMVDDRPSLVCKSPTGDAFVLYIEGNTVHIMNGIQRRITGAAVSEMAKTVRADRKKAKEALREWRRFLARVRL